MSDARRSRAPRLSRAALRRRLSAVDAACAGLNPVLVFVAIGLVLNLCLFAAADPEQMRRALIGMRMAAFEG
jgi:hypothetical protein